MIIDVSWEVGEWYMQIVRLYCQQSPQVSAEWLKLFADISYWEAYIFWTKFAFSIYISTNKCTYIVVKWKVSNFLLLMVSLSFTLRLCYDITSFASSPSVIDGWHTLRWLVFLSLHFIKELWCRNKMLTIIWSAGSSSYLDLPDSVNCIYSSSFQ